MTDDPESTPSEEKPLDDFTPIKDVTEPATVSREVFNREFSDLKEKIQEQKSLSWQIIIGIGVAFFLTVGLVIIDTSKFHYQNSKETAALRDEYKSEIYKLKTEIELLKNNLLGNKSGQQKRAERKRKLKEAIHFSPKPKPDGE